MNSSSRIYKLLDYVISNNRELQSRGRPPVALELIGEAGIGKTTLLMDFCKDHNMHVAKINLAQLDELADLIGYQIREFKTVEGKWVNEKQVASNPELYHLTDETRTSWCPPKWVPENDSDPGILILDDWTRADPRFIQACMELIDRAEYYSWKLPKNWSIILTSNPSDNSEYAVNTIDTAQRTRYLSIKMDFDVKDWAVWAESNNIDERCINFVLLNPELITSKRVNPRAGTKFFDTVASIKDFSSSLELIRILGAEALGPEFITSFVLCVTNKQDKIIPVSDIFDLPKKDVFDAILDLTNYRDKDRSKFRSSIASMLCTRIANYVRKMHENKVLNSTHTQRLIEIFDGDLFPHDIYIYMIKTLCSIDSKVLSPMYSNPLVTKCLQVV